MFSKFHKIFDALTQLERQLFQGATLVFLFSLILNSANIFYKKTILAPIEGGSYTEGLIGQPIAINPVISSNNDVDRDLAELVYSDLLELVKDYKLSNTNRTWTIELKDDLHWSDGELLTGDDVIFTIETIQDPETHSPLFQTWQGVIIEKLNEMEIAFTLKTPYAFFLDNLKNIKIIPQHIFGTIPSTNLRLSDYNFEPVGSGPYVFLSYEKRRDGFITEYQFTANELYGGQGVLIKNLKFKFFPNYEEAITAFNRKEIDGLGGISPNDIQTIKIGYQIHELNIPRYYAIFFNPSTGVALKNKEVREALELATNRSAIIETALKNKALAITGPIYPTIEGFDSELNRSESSLEGANQILEKNNWLLNEGGIRTKKNGQEQIDLKFEIVVPEIDFLIATVNTIADSWRKIGVDLKPLILQPSEIANNIIKTRNYEMIIFGNILKDNPDVFSFWHSSERFHPGLNLSLYENKTVDNLLEVIRREFSAELRVRNLKKLQSEIADDKPAIFLFSPNYLYVSPKNLGGFTQKVITTPANRFDEINKWYLKTARVFK